MRSLKKWQNVINKCIYLLHHNCTSLMALILQLFLLQKYVVVTEWREHKFQSELATRQPHHWHSPWTSSCIISISLTTFLFSSRVCSAAGTFLHLSTLAIPSADSPVSPKPDHTVTWFTRGRQPQGKGRVTGTKNQELCSKISSPNHISALKEMKFLHCRALDLITLWVPSVSTILSHPPGEKEQH